MITAMVDYLEFKKMYKFCKSMRCVYIYGKDEKSFSVKNALAQSKVKVKGCIDDLLKFRKPLIFPNIQKLGLIICGDNPEIEKEALSRGFRKVFVLPDFVVEQIVKKVTPRYNFFNFEINIADHCNMNCQCCDHFSPLSEKRFLSLESFKSDLTRIKTLLCNESDKVLAISLLGGEPTLHPDLIDFIKTARIIFPNASLSMVTNGILLLKTEHGEKGNLWQVMKDNNVELKITTYPIKLDFALIDKKAKEYGLTYSRFTDISSKDLSIKTSVIHDITENKKDIKPYEFLTCYHFNECIVLREGRIYSCPQCAYIGIFNKYFNKNLKVTKNDYIDIYKVKSYKEIMDFVSKRIPFCDYCNVKNRHQIPFHMSNKAIGEWSSTMEDKRKVATV